MMTTEFSPKRRDGMEFSRTHAHYMAAVQLFDGDSEPLVAEMYELAQDLERELNFVRARLDAVAAQELPAPAKPRRMLRTWFASLLRPWTAQGVERAVHGLVLTMAAGLIVGALVLPVNAHAEDVILFDNVRNIDGTSQNVGERYTVDWSTIRVRKSLRARDGMEVGVFVQHSYAPSLPYSRKWASTPVTDCEDGQGKLTIQVQPDLPTFPNGFWVRNGKTSLDVIATALCAHLPR